jgi:ligand-binding sensor domain-containing protein
MRAQHNQYQFSHLNVSRGLSNNQINSIFKDHKGFMWFGSAAGLNRYDGLKFKSYTHRFNDTTSLNDNYIVYITEGPDHKLWVKTKVSLNIYDPITEQFSTNLSNYIKSPAIPTSKIIDIYPISGNIFALNAREMGIYFYNSTTHSATHIYHKTTDTSSIGSALITGIVADANHNVWIIHNDGLLERLNLKTTKVSYRVNTLKYVGEPGLTYTMYINRSDRLWIYCTGADNGLCYFDTKKRLLKQFGKESAEGRLNSNIINSVSQDDDGLMWIATDHGGITLMNEKNFTTQFLVNKEDDSKSLAQNSVLSIYKDNLGIIWAGTYKKGVSYYHRNILKFPIVHHFITDDKSLPYEDVNKFVEDAKGNLWIGTNGGGLIYYNRSLNSFKQYKHSNTDHNTIGNDVVVSLCIDHDQKLWIGSYYGGLDCFDGKNFTHYRHNDKDPNSLSDDRVWQIFQDSRQRLWIGTLAGGVNLLNNGSNHFYHYPTTGKNSLSSLYSSSIVEDKKGNIWVGTSNGINVIQRSGKVVYYMHEDIGEPSLIINSVNNLLIDSRGWVWAATREGLSMLNPKTGKFKNFTKEDGLPDNNIKDILEDNAKNMWISTTNGLSNMIITGANNNTNYRFFNYDEGDGLQGLDFNERHLAKPAMGTLYLEVLTDLTYLILPKLNPLIIPRILF